MRHKYNEDERIFLKENITYVNSFEELAEKFNSNFKTALKMEVLRDYCYKSLHIKLNKNSSHFKANGHVVSKKYPIGAEVERCGYIFVKINDIYIVGKSKYKDFSENWQPKQRVIYEKFYGKIKENEIIIFLDNNKFNFSINNLYSVGRNIHAMMNKRKWYSSEPIKTLTAIMVCELEIKIKETGKNGNIKSYS